MKNLIFTLFAFGLLAGLAKAVNPVPYTEAVSFSYRASGSGSTTLTLYDESGSPNLMLNPSGSPTESDTKTALMRPGKTYHLNYTAGAATEYWLSFIPPNGYQVVVDNAIRDIVHGASDGMTYHYNYEIVLRPKAGSNEPAPWGSFSGIKIGKSISWEIGLGQLFGGRNAGRILFKEYDLDNSPADRARLYLVRPYNVGEVWTINDGPSNQTLRQVMTPSGVMDILDDGSGGYRFRFFLHSQSEGSPGNPNILYGSPWKTIHVQQPNDDELEITETIGSRVRVFNLTLGDDDDVASGTYTWTLLEGDGSPTWLSKRVYASETDTVSGISATGGSETSTGGYSIHTFSGSGTLNVSSVPEGSLIDALVIGGGGGGGGGTNGLNMGGGGGAGGFLEMQSQPISVGSFAVTVGSGGASDSAGGNSSFNDWLSYGGGVGGNPGTGGAGGSGGGGAGNVYGNQPPGAGTAGQGTNGGIGISTYPYDAGGGGGAGSYGQNGTGSGGGAGGAGKSSSISGTAVTYAGGGGGGGTNAGSGGSGGGGTGGSWSLFTGTAGAANTGSGGGGGFAAGDSPGGAGGSGIVIIRYLDDIPRREVIESVYTPGSPDKLVAQTRYVFSQMPWGEELTEMVVDPYGAALTTTYKYYKYSAQKGSFRRIKSVTKPTGDWVGYEYYDDWDRRGQLEREYRPYRDTPAVVPETFDEESGKVVYHEYAADWTGRLNRLTLRQVFINNVRTAQTVTTTGDNTPVGENPREYTFTIPYSDGTNYTQDYFEKYRGDAWPTIAHRPYLSSKASGARTTWGEGAGVYNPTTKSFSNGTGLTHYRYISINGSVHSAGAELLSNWDGHEFAPLYVISGKSTMEVTIYGGPVVIRTETWVYTGSGSFSRMSWTDYTFNPQFQIEQKAQSNGAVEDFNYTDGLLDSTIAADGTRTEYTYDKLWRVETTVKKGNTGGSYADQSDITTTYSYDGANRVVQKEVSDGSSLTLVASTDYDLAGRVEVSSAPGGYETDYEYDPANQEVRVTLPGGGEKITKTHLDGQLESVTGSAVVEQHVTYSVNGSTGQITRKVNTGSANSDSWIETTTDWRGRKVSEVKPGWASSSTVTHAWIYDTDYGYLSKLEQEGMADTLYQYDTMGVLAFEALDVSGNNEIDLNSTDRITKHEWAFFTDSGDWWSLETTKTYAQSNVTPTVLSKVEKQISGLASSQLSYTKSYDIHGNVTTQSVVVNRTAKTLTTTTDAPDSTIDAVQITYNGLTVSSKDTAGITMEYEYDGLGRLSKSIDPRTKGSGGTPLGTVTTYKSNTSQVDTVKDPAGNTQAAYDYDGAGRVSETTNAMGGKTYFKYNERGQKIRVWGDATYPVEYEYDDWGRKVLMKTYADSTADFTGSSWPGSPGTPALTKWVYQEETGFLMEKYDAANLDEGVPIAGAKKVAFTYTQAGQMKTRTLAREVVTTYGYDADTGELLTETYSDSTPSVTYTYNRLGQVETVADATTTPGNLRTFTYNLTGTLELQSEILGDDSGEFYGDRLITYGYDTSTTGAIGRPIAQKLGSSGDDDLYQSISYGYKTDGRLDTITDVLGSNPFTYAYTGGSHLIASVSTGSYTDTRTYEDDHDWTATRETMWSSDTKAKFAYTRDDMGRVTGVAKTGKMFDRYGTDQKGLKTFYGYNTRSELETDQTVLDATKTSLSGTTTLSGRKDEYDYDELGNRKTATLHRNNPADAAGPTTSTFTYTVNSLNQYTQRTVPNLSDISGFIPAGSTVEIQQDSTEYATVRHEDYFIRGHALRPGASTSAILSKFELIIDGGSPILPRDAFLPADPEAFSYDDDGNLESDGRWAYSYDAENRLIAMETNTAAIPNGSKQKLVFTYDYMGRRVRKTLHEGYNGSTYTTTVEDTKYVYNGWNLIAELHWNNSTSTFDLNRTYLWGLDLSGTMQEAGGVGGLLMIQEDGNTYLPAYDAMGNLHALMTTASVMLDLSYSAGDIVAAYEYDAYGQTIRETGGYAGYNPFRFSTKYTDNETSLVYYGHRYYSPSLGRFINRDPIEEQGGINLYSFVGNNSINAWDYLGMLVPWWEDLGIDGNDLYYDGGSYDWGNGGGSSGGGGGGVQVSSGGNDFNGSADVPGTGVGVTTSQPNPSNPNDPGVLTHTYDQTWWYDEGIDGSDYFTIQGQIDGSIRMLEPLAVSANSTYTHFSTWGTNPTFPQNNSGIVSGIIGAVWNALTGWHFEGRTARNGTPPTYAQVIGQKSVWVRLGSDQAIYHDNGVGKPEHKYIHPSGREVVFDGDTLQPITDPRYAGTYNYVNPAPKPDNWYNVGGWLSFAGRGVGHLVTDVVPYWIGGNVRGNDPSPNPSKPSGN